MAELKGWFSNIDRFALIDVLTSNWKPSRITSLGRCLNIFLFLKLWKVYFTKTYHICIEIWRVSAWDHTVKFFVFIIFDNAPKIVGARFFLQRGENFQLFFFCLRIPDFWYFIFRVRHHETFDATFRVFETCLTKL